MASGNYTAKDITVLEGLDPVRRRPGMYIGGVGSAGLHHLVWEIVDNAVDEAMNGYASNIRVTLHEIRQPLEIRLQPAQPNGTHTWFLVARVFNPWLCLRNQRTGYKPVPRIISSRQTSPAPPSRDR